MDSDFGGVHDANRSHVVRCIWSNSACNRCLRSRSGSRRSLAALEGGWVRRCSRSESAGNSEWLDRMRLEVDLTRSLGSKFTAGGLYHLSMGIDRTFTPAVTTTQLSSVGEVLRANVEVEARAELAVPVPNQPLLVHSGPRQMGTVRFLKLSICCLRTSEYLQALRVVWVRDLARVRTRANGRTIPALTATLSPAETVAVRRRCCGMKHSPVRRRAWA